LTAPSSQKHTGISLFDSSKLRHWKPNNLSHEEINDGESYHSSLYMDDTYLNPRPWHKQATEPLIELVKNKVNEGDVVIDYGSGTGGSAAELLKYLDANKITCNLILIDPLDSWFSKAYSLLGNRPDVFFCKSMVKEYLGKNRFLSLEEMIGDNKVDIIFSSSTFHLIPELAFRDLLVQFHNSLNDKGHIFWSSGDIPNEDMAVDKSGLLHEPYRLLTKFIKEDPEYLKYLGNLERPRINSLEYKASKIFPISKDISFFRSLLSEGFTGDIFQSKVLKSFDEACLFMNNNRLSEVAGAVFDKIIRQNIIKSNLEKVYSHFEERGFVFDKKYESLWYYGSYCRA